MYYDEPLEILGCKLVLTCMACPEQYDVFYQDEMVGYLRLRHGRFTAEYPDVGGKLVYSSHPMGDGIFKPQERLIELTKAVQAIMSEHKNETFEVEVLPNVYVDLSFSDATSLYNQLARLLKPR